MLVNGSLVRCIYLVTYVSYSRLFVLVKHPAYHTELHFALST